MLEASNIIPKRKKRLSTEDPLLHVDGEIHPPGSTNYGSTSSSSSSASSSPRSSFDITPSASRQLRTVPVMLSDYEEGRPFLFDDADPSFNTSPLDPSVVLPAAVVNPFRNNTTQLTATEIFKMVLCSIFLVPLRLFILGVFFPICFLLARLSIMGLSEEEVHSKPLTQPRRIVVAFFSFFARIIMAGLGIWWVTQKGEPDPTVPIYVANHISFVDIVYFVSAGGPAPMSRIENAAIPLIKDMHFALQAILVQRNSRDSRRNGVKILNSRTRSSSAKNERWPSTLVFPEGTCSNGKCMMLFKPGAFIPGVPVQPVTITYPNVSFDPSWVNGSPSSLMILFRLLIQPIVWMEVNYMPVHYPSDREIADPLLYANNVRKAMAHELNIPLTKHSLSDVLLGKCVFSEYGLPPACTGAFEVEVAKKNLGLDAIGVLAHLRRFPVFKYDPSDVTIQRKDFLEALQFVRDDDAVASLFKSLDLWNRDKIDVREFLMGSVAIQKAIASKSPADPALHRLVSNPAFVSFWTDDDEHESRELNREKENGEEEESDAGKVAVEV